MTQRHQQVPFFIALPLVSNDLLKGFLLAKLVKRFDDARMAYLRDITKIPAPVMGTLQASIPTDWPEMWADLAAVFYVGLLNTDTKNEHEGMAKIAIEQVLTAVEQIGGQQLYVPRGAKRSQNSKAEAIRSEFNGRNHAELAVRHGVTEMRIRQILVPLHKKPSRATRTTPDRFKNKF